MERHGEFIKKLRLEKGHTQESFSKFCSISRSYLSLIERGRKTPNMAVLGKIASSLNLNFLDLLITLKLFESYDGPPIVFFRMLQKAVNSIQSEYLVKRVPNA